MYQICIQARFDTYQIPSLRYRKYRETPSKRAPNTALRLMHMRKHKLAVPPLSVIPRFLANFDAAGKVFPLFRQREMLSLPRFELKPLGSSQFRAKDAVLPPEHLLSAFNDNAPLLRKASQNLLLTEKNLTGFF